VKEKPKKKGSLFYESHSIHPISSKSSHIEAKVIEASTNLENFSLKSNQE
jgi:hypothetical protein